MKEVLSPTKLAVLVLILCASMMMYGALGTLGNRSNHLNGFTSVATISSGTIAASGSYTSSWYDMNEIQARGYFGLQATVTGDGTVKFEYECSNDGVTFAEPESASDIMSSITKTSGPGSDGKVYDGFAPPPCRFIRIKITETGGANSATVTAYWAIQG